MITTATGKCSTVSVGQYLETAECSLSAGSSNRYWRPSRINYRHSVRDLATTPAAFDWSASHFTSTLHHLPGLEADATATELLSYITYPRLGPFPASGDLWLSFRTGKAGLGDDHLCVYGPDAATGEGQGRRWRLLGTPLRGVRNNPYVHGLTPTRDGGLYATWVYRGFVPYPGWDDPCDTQHKQQAGPNSAAENHDLCFAWSPDEGRTWRNGAGAPLADLARGESVRPDAPGILAFAIPRASGLTNQEAQAVDADGGVHVLNRDTLDNGDGDGGPARWKHYHRTPGPDGVWSARPLPLVPAVGAGRRGRLAVDRGGEYLYFVLPDPNRPELSVWRAARASGFAEYELVWGGRGFPGAEPLVDLYRLEHDGVLSVFTRAEGAEGVDVVVLDFQL